MSAQPLPQQPSPRDTKPSASRRRRTQTTMNDLAIGGRGQPEDRLSRDQRRARRDRGHDEEGRDGDRVARIRAQRPRRQPSQRSALEHHRTGDRGCRQSVLCAGRPGRGGHRPGTLESADHHLRARGSGARARARDGAAAPARGRAADRSRRDPTTATSREPASSATPYSSTGRRRGPTRTQC